MRILKYGRDPKAGALHRTTCRLCKTKFEWEQGEASLRPDNRDGNYFEIACPVCKHLNTKSAVTKHYYP